jgi:hypothetical protein
MKEKKDSNGRIILHIWREYKISISPSSIDRLISKLGK